MTQMPRTKQMTKPGEGYPLPALPQYFDEDLVKRCFPIRFRNIGNPNAYLNELGIRPILEYIYKGHLLIDVAEATNVPLTVLRLWIEHEKYFEEIQEAETLSAEGFLAEGMKRLRTARTEFELKRANSIIKHAQYMATKKNKPVYGETTSKETGNVVHYEFNIGNSASPEALNTAKTVIESVASRVAAPGTGNGQGTASAQPLTQPTQSLSLDLAQVYGTAPVQTATASTHTLHNPDTLPKLVARRPQRPTAINPDVGPFYDDPNDQERTVLPTLD